MRALEATLQKWKSREVSRLCRLKLVIWDLTTEENFIAMFKKSIEDLNKLGRFDLSLLWTKSMDTYLNLPNANSKYK